MLVIIRVDALCFLCIVIPLHKSQFLLVSAEYSTCNFLLWFLMIVVLFTGMHVESTEYTKSWTTPEL